jgi:hypothetical protein
MDAVPEIEVVPGRNPVDVEPIGVGKGALVARRRPVDQHDDAAGRNGRLVQCDVTFAVSQRVLRGGFISKQFFERAGDLASVFVELSPLFGVRGEGDGGIAAPGRRVGLEILQCGLGVLIA